MASNIKPEEYDRYIRDMYEEQMQYKHERFLHNMERADRHLIRLVLVLGAVLICIQIYKALW